LLVVPPAGRSTLTGTPVRAAAESVLGCSAVVVVVVVVVDVVVDEVGETVAAGVMKTAPASVISAAVVLAWSTTPLTLTCIPTARSLAFGETAPFSK
jgi:hypothetical protein